jgi:LCP family protein required for cell wall assembly
VLVAVLVLAGWIGYGYLQFRDSMTAANARVTAATRQQLKGGAGSILSDPTTILVLGSDRRPTGAASGDSSRSDSILLVRSDPGKGMLSLLSIPRDLRVDVPGIGGAKINAAYANGGPPLAIRTVQDLIGSGVPINHVVIVDFQGFRSLIDALGGVTIDNPTKIVSNSFDGHPWRFSKGRITLDGRHALAYARVRENTLDLSDNDTNRGFRQQRVLSALASSLASPRTLLHLPSVGDAIGDPLTTDLTGNDLLQLGWRKYRSSRVLHCRLGGSPDYYGGEAVLVSSEENRQVVSMFLGRSAPQPPAPTSAFAPGCTVE